RRHRRRRPCAFRARGRSGMLIELPFPGDLLMLNLWEAACAASRSCSAEEEVVEIVEARRHVRCGRRLGGGILQLEGGDVLAGPAPVLEVGARAACRRGDVGALLARLGQPQGPIEAPTLNVAGAAQVIVSGEKTALFLDR